MISRALAPDDIRYSDGLSPADFCSTGTERRFAMHAVLAEIVSFGKQSAFRFVGKAAADRCPFGPLEASGSDEERQPAAFDHGRLHP